ncbi:MAG: oligosaccharide flippase family protein [Luteolibacter sp.]
MLILKSVDSSSGKDAARRDRSIRLAVLTSFLSKAGTILLQLVSIPIAVRVLGREEFGLYTTVNLTLTTVSILQIGVGPALTHGLSKARASHDEETQRELGSTAFFLMLSLAGLAAFVLAMVLWKVPLATLYGAEFVGKEAVLRPALWVGLGLFLCLFVLNLTERVRESHLEVAVNNMWGAASNVLAAIAVGAGVWFVPQVWYLVIAVHGAKVLMNAGNTISLWRKHPLMRPCFGKFRPQVARHLFTDGLAFSSCCLVPVLVEYNLCGWFVGRDGGPAAVALYGVFISLTVMQLGFVVIISTPTWPAVAEALARVDMAWARRAAKRLYTYGSAFALCSAAGLTLLGPWVLTFWLGKEFSGISHGILACYGAYFIAHVWRHLNHTMMIGTGRVRKLVGIQFFESVLLAGAAWFALKHGGIGGMLLAMAGVIALTTGWVLPRYVWGKLWR